MVKRVPANASSSPSVKSISIFLILIFITGAVPLYAQTRQERRQADIEEHMIQGGKYFEAGQLQQAEGEFLKVVRLDPGYAEAYNNLGFVYKKQLRLRDAEIRFKQALKIARDDFLKAQVNLNLGDLLSGYMVPDNIKIRGGKKRALKYYKDALKYDENNEHILTRLEELNNEKNTN